MKSEEKWIYVVTSGEYSSYSIEGVFSTRLKAWYYIMTDARIEKIEADKCDHLKGWPIRSYLNNYQIEPFELDI